MNKSLTGIRDADKLILNELNDRDLLAMCQVDKYTKSLCNNDFFKYRSIKKLPNSLLLNPTNDNWKNFYLNQIIYMELLDKRYGFIYSVNSKATAKEYYDILKHYHDNLDKYDGTIEKIYENLVNNKYYDIIFYLLVNNYKRMDTVIKFALNNNDNQLIYDVIKKHGNPWDMDDIVHSTVNNDNFEILDYLIKLGANPVHIYNYAGRRNNYKIQRYLENNYNII